MRLDFTEMRQARKKVKRDVAQSQPLRRHGTSSVSEDVNLVTVWLETVVEALFVTSSSRNQAQSMIASDLEVASDQEETPKPNKCRVKEDTSDLTDFQVSADGVSEPELPFKSPHTLLNASQSRRTTKKTYSEAVSSEDEAEVKMRKKAVQQERQERHEFVEKPVRTWSSARLGNEHVSLFHFRTWKSLEKLGKHACFPTSLYLVDWLISIDPY